MQYRTPITARIAAVTTLLIGIGAAGLGCAPAGSATPGGGSAGLESGGLPGSGSGTQAGTGGNTGGGGATESGGAAGAGAAGSGGAVSNSAGGSASTDAGSATGGNGGTAGDASAGNGGRAGAGGGGTGGTTGGAPNGVVVGGPDGYQMISTYPAPPEATRKPGVPKATLPDSPRRRRSDRSSQTQNPSSHACAEDMVVARPAQAFADSRGRRVLGLCVVAGLVIRWSIRWIVFGHRRRLRRVARPEWRAATVNS